MITNFVHTFRPVAAAETGNLSSVEINALHSLFDSTHGQLWDWNRDLVKWSFSGNPNPCVEAWYGVVCTGLENDGYRHVFSLSLDGFNLVGTLPPQLSNFSMLNSLTLAGNELFGRLPSSLGDLAVLTYLDLSDNALEGTLPPQLGGMTTLIILNLNNNQLHGRLPPLLGGLTSLTTLNIYYNKLSGPLPPEMSGMSSLSALYAHNNFFSGPLPPELGALSALNYLDMSNNHLTGLMPSELGNLTLLIDLILHENQLTGLPATLGDLTLLISLDVCNNQLRGSLPPKLGGMTSLRTLYLYNNRLSGSLPSTMGDLTALTTLYLYDNDLRGPLPPELGKMASLTTFSVYNNQLSGPVPPELGKMASLTTLYLYDNHLSGPLPAQMGNLTSLTVLFLYDNQLVGPLPPELGGMTSLTTLYLYSNRLNGPLPGELGDLKALTTLYLYDNELSGTLPPELGDMTALKYLGLDSNHLSGPVPAEIGNLAKLVDLSLTDNHLSGQLPPEIGKLTSLPNLFLEQNYLSGTLPPELGNLTLLTSLNFYYNHLTGCVPPELSKITSATSLYLFNNQLTGPLPPQLGDMIQLFEFDMSFNTLSGPLPPQLGNLIKLIEIDMSFNQLSGPLPAELGKLTSLYNLWLSNNQLSGPLPPELGDMILITDIDVSFNQLSGPLPPELGKLTLLTELDLENNDLSGLLPSELANMTSLYNLIVNNNQLQGSFPLGLTGMPRLKYLYMQNNHVTGSLPRELGDMSRLFLLNLSCNQLSGPLPAELGNLTGLSYLYLEENYLTGLIPPQLGGMIALEYLNLSYNSLSGPIPPNLRNMNSLIALFLNNNQLSGTVPSQLSAMKSIQAVFLSSNLFTGLPPDLGGIPCISLPNNLLHGTIPALLLGSSIVQYMDLSQNFLSGELNVSLLLASNLKYFSVAYNSLSSPLPSLGMLTSLEVIDLSHNQFNGSLNGVFVTNNQGSLLACVQLEYNKFSGSLPLELFQLPGIKTIVAVSNCFTGTLPSELCGFSGISSLILDGLGTGKACPTMWTNWKQTGVLRVVPSFHGTIPECWSNLPLSNLHLSGNNLVGRIPELNSFLSQLYLSHNRLSGSLPDHIQTGAWYRLDVSYNKFKGSLRPDFGLAQLQQQYATNGSILINNSRISGTIPSTVMLLSSISMLGSNMFSCKSDKSDVPDTDGDGDKQRYQCGSDGFNYAFYLFISFAGSMAAIILLVLYYAPVAQQSTVSKWRLPQESLPQSCQQVRVMLNIMSQVAVCLTVAILAVLVPWYVSASYYHGTYTHQYAWVVSAAFLSGMESGLVMFSLWVALILFGVIVAAVVARKMRSEGLLVPARSPSMSQSQRQEFAPTVSQVDRAKAYAIFLSVNLIAVIGVNIAFVYVSLNETSDVVQLAQVALSLWKFVWNSACVPFLINQISKRFMPTRQSNGFFRVHAFMSLFNNIAIPCLVVAAQSPSCFREILFPPPPLTSSYDVPTCTVFEEDPLLMDCESAWQTQETQYIPQFSYSYECSSSFVTYYSASLTYLALTVAVIVPTLYSSLCWVVNITAHGTTLHKLSNALLPRLWKLPELEPTGPTASDQGYYMNANNLIVNMTVYLGVLLSFGVAFPPVALAMCIAMLSTAYQIHLTVGRLLVNARELGTGHVREALEADCKHAATVEKFRSIMLMVTTFACSFYALFIFDTIGDTEGFAKACWALIITPLFPAGVYAVARFLRYRRDLQEPRPHRDSSIMEASVEMVSVHEQTVPSVVHDVEDGQKMQVYPEVTVSALHA